MLQRRGEPFVIAFTRWNSLGICFAVILLITACGPDRTESIADSPAIRSVGTLVLLQPSANPVGDPGGMALGPLGTYLIADLASRSILEFSPTGAFLRRFGGPGNGPEEFQAPQTPAVIGDSLLLVPDIYRRDVSIIDLATGAFRQRLQFDGPIASLLVTPRDVVMGAVSFADRTSAILWTPGSDSVRRFGPLPAQFSEGGPLVGIRWRTYAAQIVDTIVVGFEAADVLYFLAANQLVDSLIVPFRIRKGAPPDVAEQMDRMRPEQQFTLASSLWGLYPFGARGLLLAHLDLSLDPAFRFPLQAGEKLPLTRRLFVSIVSLDRRAACVDVEVPIAGEATPGLAVRADTLFVLDMQTSSTDAELAIRKYHLGEGRCKWRTVEDR